MKPCFNCHVDNCNYKTCLKCRYCTKGSNHELFHCGPATKRLNARANAVLTLAGYEAHIKFKDLLPRLSTLAAYAKTDMHIRSHKFSPGYQIAPVSVDVNNPTRQKLFGIDFERVGRLDKVHGNVEVSNLSFECKTSLSSKLQDVVSACLVYWHPIMRRAVIAYICYVDETFSENGECMVTRFNTHTSRVDINDVINDGVSKSTLEHIINSIVGEC